ncbi:Glycosyltransferase family 4 protein [Rhodovastum atsumiense]|uniref:Glycosyltransferase family 4 protein n=1 Tax=Rhodovastum atsumiense TaxID=504468 RepID=A0A5M6ISY8_9PROT|nr:glycosyltransferase family 4 protein [Rhodovastum atsumiense]KAA5610947.1 glycosyltransferase family 4 protein [Rhodovastum atsumiense]CAH2601477.1 Glycosyltransferase family 4 protein [Rhodovastum atsumiense]
MNQIPSPPPGRILPPRRILWTMPYVPWPTTNGGKVKGYALLRQMAARGHAITLLCLTKEMPDEAARAHLESFLDELIVLPRRPRASPGRLLRAALSLGRPTVATINGCDPNYSRMFDTLLQRDFDIVQIEHSYAFEPFDAPLRRRGVPFLLNEHNVESQVVHEQYRRLPSWLRPLARLDAARARIWERQVLRRAACVIACSETDRDAFAAVGAHAVLLPHGIDLAPFATVRRDASARRVVFLGNYEYAPNVDAVHWLCEAIMPELWRTEPQARLAVYGHAMPQEWRRRWADARLEFHGYAASVAEVHAASSVFVAPLRSGGGSKLKVLEAMASAMPIVATREALTGLALRDSVDVLCGETADELADGLARCLHQPAMATRLGENARAVALAEHDWQAVGSALERIHATCLCPPTETATR